MVRVCEQLSMMPFLLDLQNIYVLVVKYKFIRNSFKQIINKQGWNMCFTVHR